MTTDAWSIRRPTPDDAEALGRMHHASRREAYGHVLPESYWAEATVEASVARWRHLLGIDTPGRRLAMAEQAGRVVGLAAAGAADLLQPPGFTAVRQVQLYLLYVLADWHGTGVAQRLLEAVLAIDEPAQLWVAEDNPRARAFYLRNGFRADGGRALDDTMAGLAEIRMVR